MPVNSFPLEAIEGRIENRIEHFIAILGVLMAVGAQMKWGGRAAAGEALGAGLCWLNFRWLRHGATGVDPAGNGASGRGGGARSAQLCMLSSLDA